MSTTKKMPPVHPGEMLRAEFMEPYGLSQNELARQLDVSPRRINEIVNERRGITADTALRLAKFFDMSEGYWLNLQKRYELEAAKDEMADSLDRVGTLEKA